ncbi:Trm112 family protein [Parasphingopyxis sp. CP4]|uniref:Trm112 family protein n=1 Tax=Parasphingopyxis sp. CP4 TaxID=2724527 RepID=UPI00159FA970|nr:Trm112 family protein [Parasphingopyxis sp. CP4]QLC22727.1 Trm112 family protein [Parasphingopyxis sp. CP4]
MTSATPLDPELLAILVCPVTRTPLRYDREADELISEAAGLAYPIRDGVPVMLVEEARKLGASR